MIRVTLKGLAAHKLRFVLTGLAVSLGVAFMAGTMIFNATLRHGFDSLLDTGLADTDVIVRSVESFESSWGTQREPIDTALLDSVLRVEGVAAADVLVEGYAQLVDADGDAVRTPGNNPPTLGSNWIDHPRLNPWSLEDGSRAPRADDEIVVDLRSARQAGFEVGDVVTVLTQRAPEQFRLVGVARWGEVDTPMGATMTLFTRDTAERLVGERGKAHYIQVLGEDGISQQELRHRVIRGIVTTRAEVVTGDFAREEAKDELADALSFINTFLLVFALIALFVGSFIIFNTFSITIAQRTKEIALARAIGASRGQVLSGVLLEAVIIGLVASAIGLAFGLVLAVGLRELLASFGMELPSVKLQVGTASLLPALVAGVAVTMVAAVFPARRAAGVAPIAALRDVAVDRGGHSAQRAAAGAVILALGSLSAGLGLFTDASGKLGLVGAGSALVFLGVAVLGPVFARPLARVVGAPLELRGMTGHLAHENAMRNPKRTSATASALMIGVALVSLITILAASSKASIAQRVDDGMQADLYLTVSGGMGWNGFSPELSQRVSVLREVEATSGVRIGEARAFGGLQFVLGINPRGFVQVWDVGEVEGDLSSLSDSGVAVSRELAREHGLELGSIVPMTFARTGEDLFRVQAILERSAQVEYGDVLVNTHAFDRNFVLPLDTGVYVKLAGGVGLDQGRSAVEAVAERFPNVDVQDREELKSAVAAEIDQMLNLMYALLALAVVIALIGIANTLALSIHERTRELGLLRAVGLTRPQLRAVVRWEAFVIALLGSGLGLLVGAAFGWALVRALESEGMEVLRLPLRQLVVVAALASVAGVVAALQPSRRAAKLDVLRAIQSE
jgi:putative ABC transport system permease protein